MNTLSAIRPQAAVVNDIDLTMARPGIVDVTDAGGLIYADGITVHLTHPVLLELVREFDRWNQDIGA